MRIAKYVGDATFTLALKGPSLALGIVGVHDNSLGCWLKCLSVMCFFFPSLWWNCVQLPVCVIYTYKISCLPNSGKYLRTLSKEAENPTGFMIAVEKLAPPEADASLETCTALRKCVQLPLVRVKGALTCCSSSMFKICGDGAVRSCVSLQPDLWLKDTPCFAAKDKGGRHPLGHQKPWLCQKRPPSGGLLAPVRAQAEPQLLLLG